MLEQLLQGLQGQVGKEIQEKVGVDSNMVSKIMDLAGGVAAKEVGNEMMNGGLSTVMNLFSNNENSSSANSLQSNMSSKLLSGLVGKLGLDQGKADMVTSMVIPSILNLITQKNNETPDTDSSSIEELVKSAAKGGIKDMLGGFFK